MKCTLRQFSWLSYLLGSIVFLGLSSLPSWAQQPILQPIQVVEAPFGVLTAASIAGSADGRYLYVTDQDERALLVLARTADTGALQFVEMQNNFYGDIPVDVVLSPDDAYLYVTKTSRSYAENSIVIFARDSTTGRLTAVEGPAFNGAMRNPVDLVISPDGGSIYVAAYADDALAIFQRDRVTGKLTYRESLIDGQNGIDKFSSLQTLAMSPDSAYLYAGANNDSAINVFARTAATSALTLIEVQQDGVNGLTGIGELQALRLSADGSQLFAISNASTLTVFQRNPNNGKLTFQQQLSEGVGGVTGLLGNKTLTVSQNNRDIYVYTRDYTSPTAVTAVTQFQRNTTTGLLTFSASYTETQAVDFDDPQEIFLPVDGKQLYTSRRDGLGYANRNLSTGALLPQPTYTLTFPIPQTESNRLSLAAPALSPDGQNLYVPGWEESIFSANDETLSVFKRDDATGELTAIQLIHDNGGSNPLHSAVAVAVSPDGNFVYATGYWSKIARYARNHTTGRLIVLGVDSYENNIPSLSSFTHLLMSADGQQLYVGGARYNGATGWDAAVLVFNRTLATGELTLVETKMINPTPFADYDDTTGLALTPDGKHLYAASGSGATLTLFQRDPNNGLLTFVESYHDGSDGVDGLAGAAGVTVSADGTTVYVVGATDRAVTLFSRNLTTGKLTWVETWKNGVAGIDGLTGVRFVQLSPDGAWLYTAGWGYLEPTNPQAGEQNALTVFARDAQNGKLTFVEKHEDEVGGITTLDGASGLQVSANGKEVYTTSSFDDAITVFRREKPAATPTSTVTNTPTPTNIAVLATTTATPPPTATPTVTATHTPTPTTRHLYLPNVQK